MTITLYDKSDFRGDAFVVQQSHSVMDDTPIGHGAMSARLTSAQDRVLLCRRPGWHGQSLFIQGPASVSHLGRVNQGGKVGLGNDVRSVRSTVFGLRVHVHIVTKTDGTLPGGFPTETFARDYAEQMVDAAALIYADKLLRLDFTGVDFVADDDLFDVRGDYPKLIRSEAFSYRQGHANVIIVDRVGLRRSVVGKARPACIIERIALEVQKGGDFPDGSSVGGSELAGYILAHELGHFLGLVHRLVDKDNLMRPTFRLITDTNLKPFQVEQLHDALGRADGTPDQLRVLF